MGQPCNPGRVAGVNVDAVVVLRADAHIYIEVTEHDRLNKVRDDVNKLVSAKLTAMAKGIFASGYCVIDGRVTPSMKEAGAEHLIQVMTVAEFEATFYNFPIYETARSKQPFGSAVNPLTGKIDTGSYVDVSYVNEKTKKDVRIADIITLLESGRKIILKGEYGSGKSRCIREVFSRMSKAVPDSALYPMAINLRDCWGLKRAGELIRRHMTDLGLEEMQSNAVKAALSQSVVFLLDGFDELGSQAWSNDDQKLKSIRLRSMEGVRDLVKKSDAGLIIAGREHYFSGDEEMLSALGVDKKDVVILKAKSEFTEEEMEEYFENRNLDVAVPSWLPRRPLICQTAIDLPDADAQEMFGLQGNEAAFWNHFIRVVATRDSFINASFDPDTILQVLVNLARITRTKSTDVGPITLEDVQRAFELAVGKLPVEDASAMLQRLPSLGRIGAESADRQFIDVAILDTLRARDVLDICRYDPDRLNAVAEEAWANPLGDLGQRVASQSKDVSRGEVLKTAVALSKRKNTTLAADLTAALTRGSGGAQDFEGLTIKDGVFSVLDFGDRELSNLSIKECVIHELRLKGDPPPKNVKIEESLVGHVVGVTSAGGLPAWVRSVEADNYDSAQNVAAIRRIGLSIAHEILVAIVKKTFFQPGAGRKEEALVRGLKRISRAGVPEKILAILQREGALTRFKGDQGWVYAPERSQAGRMKKMLEELSNSQDEIWTEVSSL